jgi:MFS family permease
VTAQPTNRFYLLGLLVLIYTSNYVDRVIVGVVGQSLKTDLQLTDAQLGLLNGMAFILFYALMGVPLGHLADRANRKWLLSSCLALWSLMTTLSGFAGSFAQLMAARIGVGIGEAGSTPVGHSLISDSFPPEKRGTAVAVFGAGAPMGIIIGTVGGGWVAQHYGWRAGMMAVGLPGLVLALLLLTTIKEPVRGSFDAPTDQKALPLRQALRTLLVDPLFRHVAIGLASAAVAVYSISAFAVPLLMRSYHLSLFGAASAFGLSYGLSGVAGSFIGGPLTDRAAKSDPRWYTRLPAIVYTAAGALLILALYAPNYGLFVALFVPGAVLLYIGLAPALSVLLNRFSPHMRGSVSALTLLITNVIGLGLGPVLSGLFSDSFAARAFHGGGIYSETCRHNVVAAIKPACDQASFVGLQHAMTVVIAFLFVSALIYARAGRHVGSGPTNTVSPTPQPF